MRNFLVALPVFIVVLFSSPAFAQVEVDTIRYQITTTDGNRYVGTIVHQDNESILFESETLGQITLLKRNILRLEQLQPGQTPVDSYIEEWPRYPQSNRYFVTSNGYGLKKGEGYYQNTWVLFNHVNYGVTDNFSIGAGIVPLIIGEAVTPLWITPRFTIPVAKDRFNIGVGAFIGTLIGQQTDALFTLLNAVATIGSRDKNFSFGLAYGYSDGELTPYPLVTLSAMIRTGPKGYFITENMFIPDEVGALISVGGRRMIQNIGLDYGAVLPIGSGIVVLIPWLGVNIPFGQ
jgi:hypothetical protein